MKRLAFAFFVAYLVALIYPGYTLFNDPARRILGFPLSFAWVILWVVLGWVVLVAVHLFDRPRRQR